MSKNIPSGPSPDQDSRYWKKNITVLSCILVIWFIVSFGCGILFRDWLDVHFPKVGNAPFGFWMAQQGSIICFVLLLIAYSFLMNRLDERSGYQSPEHH
ncbi:DUF4212 domain-containing protein [Verrucomicrobiaceae bacterium R5-34]|uniref:DUF4212 domain-containing protein n=1 Tax=Oceaniferula flava TaxID=2800421 RepID=A0AAE2SG11_9BACT|nr:DUF4212 domain-containing protein [Oceaniferula flavus]MBK1831870.1 DUF4212 domain-containing protein [Verrucomicrobiaceae bacterium R5-34]MBK1856194.1 DUF4212 domain-containing protein [Oceaniferula flavus]MBM1137501.1 DUF4212 domain-containing protein [Oceaniferula flavus]